MKHLKEYIIESIKKLQSNETGIIVFDIDDTLLKSNSDYIKVIKYINGDKSKKQYLSSEEFAKDPDVEKHKDWFDFSEFMNPTKCLKSILNGTPILKNLRILDSYINAGYEFCFLTARGCEDTVKYAIKKFIKYKDTDGKLKDIDKYFNHKESAAINDVCKFYKGSTDAEKKANVLKNLCRKYNKVIFVDDDEKNIKNAKELHLKNLKIIKAWK